MPRNLTWRARRHLLRSDSEDVLLWLLTISHPAIKTQRLVRNNEAIVSRGMTFQPWAFDITLAADDGQTLPSVDLVISNTDQRLMATIRRAPGPVACKIECVMASSPDVVEDVIDDLLLRSVRYGREEIIGTITSDDLLGLRFPADDYRPAEYRGLF